MNRLRLENYRCFREEQEAVLAPLTLLVGENSTGKTSFMAAVRVLLDLLYGHRVPDFKEEPYDLGSFDDIAHYRGGRGGRADTFKIGFDSAYQNNETQTSVRSRFDVSFGERGVAPFPYSFRLTEVDNKTWIEFRTGDAAEEKGWQLRFGVEGTEWIADDADFSAPEGRVPPFLFLGAVSPVAKNSDNGRIMKARKIRGSDGPVADEREHVRHLRGLLRKVYQWSIERDIERNLPYAGAPVRSKPRRTYDPSRLARDPEGTYVPMYLAYLNARKRMSAWNRLKEALEAFGKDSGLFDEIAIRRLGKLESDPFQLQIRKFGQSAKGPKRNIIDVGYGVSQVLPVVAELLGNQLTPVFLLQQPEVHLHPSAQAALGSLFCRIAGPERQLIVETHSDHMLDRIRMDVRDGVFGLKPEDVSILFFERRNLAVQIFSLRIDDQGNLCDAPQSYRRFFMDEVRRSLRL